MSRLKCRQIGYDSYLKMKIHLKSRYVIITSISYFQIDRPWMWGWSCWYPLSIVSLRRVRSSQWIDRSTADFIKQMFFSSESVISWTTCCSASTSKRVLYAWRHDDRSNIVADIMCMHGVSYLLPGTFTLSCTALKLVKLGPRGGQSEGCALQRNRFLVGDGVRSCRRLFSFCRWAVR